MPFCLQGAEAFVSFVKAYSKHEAAYIFRIRKLDLIGVAQSFGLLRLPRMPELKDMPRNGWEDAEVDVGLIPVFAPPHRSILFSLYSGIRTVIPTMHGRRSACRTWKTGRKYPQRTKGIRPNVLRRRRPTLRGVIRHSRRKLAIKGRTRR